MIGSRAAGYFGEKQTIMWKLVARFSTSLIPCDAPIEIRMKELTKKISEGVLFSLFYIHGQTISTLGYRPPTAQPWKIWVHEPPTKSARPDENQIRQTYSIWLWPKNHFFFSNLLMKIPKSQISASTPPFPTDWIRKHKYPNAWQPH